MQPRRGGEDSTRRLLDLMIGFLGIALLSPLMALIALLIKAESRGPILFSQERVGRDGRRFKILKFRSMQLASDSGQVRDYVEDAGALGAYRFRARGRKTVVGRALRACSLDELPNLLNVIRGELHVVGPRPDEPELVAKYKPEWHARHQVAPGITGLAQIKGRTDLTYNEMMAYDLRYVENRSLKLDAAILHRTLSVVLGRRGAR